jgi:hypothetical protein
MQDNILVRLISARHMFENSGPVLNRHSDSRSVAQAVLISHDASELTLSALSEALKLPLPDRISFPDLVGAIDSSLPGGLSGKTYFERLNKVRVAFKHRGELPDSGTWFDAIENTSARLDAACLVVLGISLAECDLAKLILSSDAQRHISAAQKQISLGNHQEALEEMARALEEANHTFPPGLWVIPGEADAQSALLFSGYGVEPSSFLTMQNFLPRIGADEIQWTLREFGHPANWTRENARFCLDTAVSLILRLQLAKPQPMPVKFHDVYRDIITVLTDEPTIRQGHFFTDITFPLTPNPFSKGDTIRGSATASIDEHGKLADLKWDLEDAEWVKIDNVSSEKLDSHSWGYLMLRRKDVSIRHEENPDSFRALIARGRESPQGQS